MDKDLRLKVCVPCQGGIPPLSDEKAQRLLVQVPEWEIKEGGHHLYRYYQFEDFVGALSFINKVGKLSEDENHHPDIEFGWDYAGVKIYSHKIDGLHENDFIMAAKIDSL